MADLTYSEQQLAQAVSSTLSANKGARSSSASSTLTLLKKQSIGSEITVCWCAITSHFLLLRHKPIASPSVIIFVCFIIIIIIYNIIIVVVVVDLVF